MEPQRTLLSWAAPASRDLCHRVSGSSKRGRQCQREQGIQEGAYNPLQLDVLTGITLQSQGTESMELEERLRGPRQLGPRAGCYISWFLAFSHIYVFIHDPWLLSVLGCQHSAWVVHNAGPSYRTCFVTERLLCGELLSSHS